MTFDSCRVRLLPVAALTLLVIVLPLDAALSQSPPTVTGVESDKTGRYVTVTFSESLVSIDWFTTQQSAAFTFTTTSGSTPTVEDGEVTGTTLKLTLETAKSLTEGATVTLSYNPSGLDNDAKLKSSADSTLVAAWSSQAVTNKTDMAPKLVSVTALWDVITLTYNETLNEDSEPDKSAFTISDKPYSVEIESVTVSGKTVALATSYVIRGNLSPQFQLRYDAPSTSPLQQADGAKDAPDFYGKLVVSSTPTSKPAFQSAAVDGATLTITFDLPLQNVAGVSAFAVGGVTGVSVSSTSYSGKVVTLTLSSAVSASDTVTIAYTKPSASPRIEARNTKDADTFAAKSVTNNTPDPAPTFSSASINDAGDTLTITMSKNLLMTTAGAPAKSAFTISGGTAAITAVAVSGKTVALTLSPKADEGETITIAYTKPTGANDGKLQSATGGHIVADWTAQSVTNGADGKPRPTSASVNGATLTITFNRALDTASKPSGTTFTINGTTATVSSVAISGSTATLTLNAAVAHDAVVTVSYTKPMTGGLKRSGKEIFTDSFSTFAVTNNTPDPTPKFSSASINDAGDTLTITMSKNLLATTAGAPAKSAFTISGGTAAITAVTVEGKTVKLTLSPKADEGETITIAYTKPTGADDGKLQSATGGHLVASWTAQSVTNGADGKPRPSSASVNGATLSITFDRALDTSSKPAASTFTLGGTTATVSSAAISASTATLTLNAAVAHDATITVGYTKPNSGGLKRSGKEIFTDSFSAFAVTNNTPDPTPKFSSASINAAGDTLTITMSKNLLTTTTGIPAKSAFTISGGTAAITTVTVEDKTVKLPLSPKADTGETITIAYTKPTGTNDGKLQSATGGHIVATWTAQSVTNGADGKPRPTSAAVNGATLTITFDRALNAASVPAKTDFTLDGTTTTVSSVAISGSTVTLTLSAAVAHGDTITVTYAKPMTGGLKRSGKEIFTDSFSAFAVTNNTPNPTPKFSSASINAAGDTLTITMSKNLLATTAGAPAKSAFTISGGTAAITAVAVSGKTVALTLSPTADQGETITIAYTKPTGAGDGKLQSATGGHLVASWTAQSVTNNADGKPRPSSATVNGATLAITFDRALDTTSKPSGTTFTINGTTATVSSVAISGSTATLTLSTAVAHNATITVTYTKPTNDGLKRSGKEIFTDSFSAFAVTNNTPNPTPKFSSASINAAGDTLTITMSKNLLTTTTGIPAKSAFTISGGTAAITAATVEGKTVKLTLSPKADTGETITIAYTKPTGADDGKLQSATGGHLVASWTAQSVTNGADGKPRPSSALVNGATLAITFDRALDTSSVPAGSRFTINGTTATVSSVAISGSTATLTLSAAVAHGDTITVTYAKPTTGGLKRSGKEIFTDSFSAFAVTNNTPDPTPKFSSASINDAGDTLTITMSKNLLATSAGAPAKSAFTISGGTAAITAVAVSGKTVALTLSPTADQGETITIAYTKPTGADDGKLQSATGGHLVASWTAQSVTNNADGKPRPTSATVNGATLTITFDRALDASSVVTKTDFTLGGTTTIVSSVAISGSTVTLTLSAAVAHDDTITVSYTKPTTGGLKRSGKEIFTDSFSTFAVTNNTPDPTPKFSSASINAAGDTLTITMSKNLLTTTTGIPAKSAFTLSGGTAAVTAVAVSGKTVALTLSPTADQGETITIAYTKPTGANDGKLQSATGGHLVASWTAQSVTNGADGKPRPASAAVNGATLAITFDRALDASSVVTKTDFALGGTTATVSSVAISGSTATLTLSAAVAHRRRDDCHLRQARQRRPQALRQGDLRRLVQHLRSHQQHARSDADFFLRLDQPRRRHAHDHDEQEPADDHDRDSSQERVHHLWRHGRDHGRRGRRQDRKAHTLSKGRYRPDDHHRLHQTDRRQ